MVNKKKNPKFVRWLSLSVKRVRSPWRRPKCINSKILEKRKGKLQMPTVGYRGPLSTRYLHPSGFREIIVNNVGDLNKVDSAKEAVRISATVGRRKKEAISKKAGELKLKILNP